LELWSLQREEGNNKKEKRRRRDSEIQRFRDEMNLSLPFSQTEQLVATYLNEHAAGKVPIGAVQRFDEDEDEDEDGIEQSACRFRATGDGRMKSNEQRATSNQQTKQANAEHTKKRDIIWR
jgi:hypothetical protein